MKRYLREQFMRHTTSIFTAALFLVFSGPQTFANSAFSGGASGFGSTGSNSVQDQEGNNVSIQNHSDKFTKCEKMASMSFLELMGSNVSYMEIMASDGIKEQFIEAMKGNSGTDTTSNGSAGDASTEGSINDSQARRIGSYIDQFMVCEAARLSFDAENYQLYRKGEVFESKEGEASSTMASGAMQCMGMQDQAQQQTCMMQQAQNSGQAVSCKHFGPETHDFRACKKILNFIDGFAIGKNVMGVQQQFRVGASAIDAQSDLAKKAREQGGIKVQDGMAVQRDSLEQQGNMAYEMAAFDAAKAGTLLAMLNDFPRPKELISHCNSQLGQEIPNSNTKAQELVAEIAKAINPSDEAKQTEIANKITQGSSFLNGSTASPDAICTATIGTGNRQNNALFENQDAIEKVRALAVKSGLEALANGAKGALLHDQANMVDDAIKDIQEFEPPDFPVAEIPEETASECLVDATAEGCIAPVNTAFDGFRSGGFNATIGGSANLGDNSLGANLDDDASSTSANGAKRDLIPNSFGTVEAQGNSDNSFEGGVAGAGSIKAGQAAAGGGGGGAGGGGGGGFGGASSANKQAAAKKPSGVKNVKIKTKGDGLGVVGGRGRIGAAKKSKSDNPFSKLLGKSKAGNSTLNFRGPAQVGSKKGSIFQMISNRYGVVQKDRLLKYEAKDQ